MPVSSRREIKHRDRRKEIVNRFLHKYSKQFSNCATLWLFLFGAVSAYADNSKISPDLLPLLNNTSTPLNVVVQYNQPLCGGGLLGGLLCVTVNLLGGVVNDVLGLVNAVTGTLLPGDIVTLSNQSNVSYVSMDRPVRPMLDFTAAAVNAQYAWGSSLDGTGVGI